MLKYENTREKFVNKISPSDVKIKIQKKKENKTGGILSKCVIKFIFISASFSQLELDKWWQYFKGNLLREK